MFSWFPGFCHDLSADRKRILSSLVEPDAERRIQKLLAHPDARVGAGLRKHPGSNAKCTLTQLQRDELKWNMSRTHADAAPKAKKMNRLQPLAKVRTGITGFDEISGGGVPAGRPTLVCGS